MGLIAIEGLHFYSHHGYYKEEQVLGGQYTVDIYLEKNLLLAARSDKLEDTINYEEVYKLVKIEMEQPAHLIEHICKRIVDKIGNTYSDVTKVKVRVSKLNPPLKGTVERVYVEVEDEF